MPLTAELPVATMDSQVETTESVETPTLPMVLQAIRHDALLESDRYLEEARVPFGGE